VSPFPVWSVKGRAITIDRPLVMAILNVTPDGVSDGGRSFSSDADVFDHAAGMLDAGADIIDIGGESTRPGARAVAQSDELRRVIPIIERLARERPNAAISVDTTKSAVARQALEAGAHIVNDVSGLRFDPGIATVCAHTGAGLVVLHSRGGTVSELATYAHATYEDPVREVFAELKKRVDSARTGGVKDAQIVLDPGVGFAKKADHSLAVMAAIPQLATWGYPVLIGASRKRFIGDVTGVQAPAARLSGTLGANVAALALGARIFRVHDVRPAREALDVAWAVLQGNMEVGRGGGRA
jgi:dihydropteroate synthase